MPQKQLNSLEDPVTQDRIAGIIEKGASLDNNRVVSPSTVQYPRTLRNAKKT
jgi:hypothetical protein